MRANAQFLVWKKEQKTSRVISWKIFPEDLAKTFDELECSAEKKTKETLWGKRLMPLKSTCKNILQVENINAAVTWWKWLTWNLAMYCIIIAVIGSTVWWNWSSDGDTYKPQKEWFGNKDVSVHGVMFLYREEEEGLLLTEYHDTFSETNDTQNCFLFVLFFNASCLGESVNNLKCLHCNKNSTCFIGLDFWSTDKKCLNQHSLCQC